MSVSPGVSIVIVSRDRPADLARILTSLRYLQYPKYEVIVVSRDHPKTAALGSSDAYDIKHVPFDEANISAARNLGIAQSAGEIIAFCDDDAVPEPTWLLHLAAPFQAPDVAAAGGFVRSRNGISFQWKGRKVDWLGRHDCLLCPSDAPVIGGGDLTTAIKTEGTNCAFRKTVLMDLGGFDENFRYYLDESDINMRLAAAGWKTAIVPLAQVHHGFGENLTRNSRRTPRSLYEIGASKAYYCAKHAPIDIIDAEIIAFKAEQRRRLTAFMLRGDLDPAAVNPIFDTLLAGLRDGQSRRFRKSSAIFTGETARFLPFRPPSAPTQFVALTCRPWGWLRVRKMARSLADQGVSVTVFCLSLTSIFHKMRFVKDGFWLQTGGQFGRSERSGAIFRWYTNRARSHQEIRRLSPVRPLVDIGWRQTAGRRTNAVRPAIQISETTDS